MDPRSTPVLLRGQLAAFSFGGSLEGGASFKYGGITSSDLLPGWSIGVTGSANDQNRAVIDQTDPTTGLHVRLDVFPLPYEAAIEWVIEFSNESHQESALLELIRPLDVVIPTSHQPSRLHTLHGSSCSIDDFRPIQRAILPGEPIHLEPKGGRSSDTAMPFFAVDLGDRQFAWAIGWSGQWVADLELQQDGLRVSAGLADAALVLHPGEVVRSPSILMLAGTSVEPDAVARLRSILSEHYVPRAADGGPLTPIAHMTMANFHRTGIVSEEHEIATVARGAELGLEAHWVDACWYGNSPNWSGEVGNWSVRRDAFPRGLRPVRDAAHRAGMKFVFWMEPERARANSALAAEHPQFFLRVPDDETNLLLDLGQPEARDYVLELVSGYIDEFGVDIYRQDFNISPLPAWRAADAPHRAGLTEIRYIEGLYRLWDALLERHPGLVIDNCASGGRRIDLETTRRSVPLWRSDFADVGGGAEDVGIDVANQLQTSGLSRWIPQHTGPVWSFDAYATRSAISTGVVIYRELPSTQEEQQQAALAVTELKRLRAAMKGAFYPLGAFGASPEDWCAYQFHDPATDSGFALFFRRSERADSSITVGLRGLTDGEYQVTLSEDYATGQPNTQPASELTKIVITLPVTPSSMLLEYAGVT